MVSRDALLPTSVTICWCCVMKVQGQRPCIGQNRELSAEDPSAQWRKVNGAAVSGLPGGSVVKNLPAAAGDGGCSPRPGRTPMSGAAKPLSHSYQACAPEPGSRNYQRLCA